MRAKADVRLISAVYAPGSQRTNASRRGALTPMSQIGIHTELGWTGRRNLQTSSGSTVLVVYDSGHPWRGAMRRCVLLCALLLVLDASAGAQPQGAPNSPAASPLWHYYCGSDAKENWNLSCKITKNTIRTNSSDSDAWADPFRDVQTITVCLAFDNRGGLHEDTATVLYATKDGGNSTPLTFFDTIKYASNMTAGKFSWVGTNSRRSVFLSGNWTMRGELSIPVRGSPTYREVLANGQKTIGEMDASCSPLDQN
jgi:hypothetical protein